VAESEGEQHSICQGAQAHAFEWAANVGPARALRGTRSSPEGRDEKMITLLYGWLVGLVLVFFPQAVWRFYRWFIGPDFERRNPHPRGIRNSGIACLVIMAVISVYTWVRR
jgi:hypothetical protein